MSVSILLCNYYFVDTRFETLDVELSYGDGSTIVFLCMFKIKVTLVTGTIIVIEFKDASVSHAHLHAS